MVHHSSVSSRYREYFSRTYFQMAIKIIQYAGCST